MYPILFRTCLGLNDDKAIATQTANPKTGATELIDCLNITTTADGAVQKLSPFVTALTHSAPITNISAGARFIYQDGIDTKEWNGTDVATIGAVLDGPVAHTPNDVRVSGPASIYKGTIPGAALIPATRGDLSNLPDRDKKPYYAQPLYKQAFEYNGRLYGINAADPRFLQYSEDVHHDVFALADCFIGHAFPILQAGAIPGALICTHETGVSVYIGTNMEDFVKRFYPCQVIAGTLWSGYVNKTYTTREGSRTYGHCHVFLCADGVYIVTEEGELINLTAARTGYLAALNSSYTCAVLDGAKYLAFGNAVAVEYDFETNSVLKRSPRSVVAAALWNNVNYYAVGATVATVGPEIDTGSGFTASLTLPFSDMGGSGTKSFQALYFTGRIGGDVLFTATDQTGKSWEIGVSALGTVTNYRIKTPKGLLGNHVSLKIACTAGAFRMEELSAEIAVTKHSR